MSEWGRDGMRPAGGSAGGRGFLFVFALLALGIAGADLASRAGLVELPFIGSGPSEAQSLRQQIAALEQSLLDAQESAKASPQIDDLNREIDQQVEEIRLLQQERDAMRAGDTESVLSLRSQLQQLRSVQIPALEKELGNRDRLLKEMEVRLQLAQEVTTDLQGRLDKAFNTDLADMRTALAERDAMLKTLDGEIARLEPLEAEIKTLRQGAKDKAGTPLPSANEAKLKSELVQAQKQVADLQTDIAALKLASAKAPVDPDLAGDAATNSQTTLTTRDPLKVAGAMRDALGLNLLDNSERDRIATGLIEGECVSKVLSEVLGRAPAVPTRDLIRALNSDC